MNTYAKLKSTVLVLALIPLATVACDEGPVEVQPIREVEQSEPEPIMVLRPNRLTLHPGDIYKLDAVIMNGRDELHPSDIDLEWNSSDPDVLIPLGEGLIQALAPGEVTVEADYRWWSAQATVEVVHPREPKISRGH